MSVQDLPPVRDFLEQFAESFGVGQDQALLLLGKLIVSYEPSWRREPQSLASDNKVGNRPSRAA